MPQFKILTSNNAEMTVEASRKTLSPGTWHTKNTRARIGDTVEVENGLGVKIQATRIAYKPKSELNLQLMFGTALKTARINRNMIQKEVAEQAEVRTEYIYQIETGRANLTLKQLQKIIEAIGVRKVEIKLS